MAKKQTIEWMYQEDILSSLNEFQQHECKCPNYTLINLKKLSERKESLGLGEKYNPIIRNEEAYLVCNSCYKHFEIIYEYGHNSKTDHFEVIEIKIK